LVQLQEVFLNLIVNAFESLEKGAESPRRVIIRTKRDGDARCERFAGLMHRVAGG